MSRALTSGELANIRTDGQRCLLYLAFVTREFQDSWLTGNVTPPVWHDGVNEVSYTLTSGDLANVKAGMTAYFFSGLGGSGTLLGTARVRKAPTATTLYIGETSEIQWIDVRSFQVYGEFKLWQRHPRVDEGTVYMDYDVAYSDQHTATDPTPVMGPPVVALLPAGGGTVDVQFDASDSWSLDGSPIVSYLWECPYADAIDDPTLATPTMTFSFGWNFDVWLTVTTAAGKSFTGWRPVIVLGDGYYEPYRDFSLDSCTGDWQGGGWNFRATLYDADSTEIHGLGKLGGGDMVVLFSRDFYGDDEGQIGALAGRGNIVAVGYLNGESIERDALVGSMSFEVQGPHWVLGNMTGFAAGVEDTDQGDLGGGAATAWTNFEDLTPRKAAWHWLHWRTTLTGCHDVFIEDDPEARQAAALAVGEGTLWEQLQGIVYHSILAKPSFDRCGRLFIQIDAQTLQSAERGTIPVVMDLLKGDWINPQTISRQDFNLVGRVEVSGISYQDGTATALCGRANGNTPDWHGKVQRYERLLFKDVNQMLELAAALWGMHNNPYPSALTRLAGIEHVIDVAPRMYFRQDVAEGDTLRGIVWSQKRLLPRRVSHRYDAETGVFGTEVDFEPEAGLGQAIQTGCRGFSLPGYSTFTPPGLPPWRRIPPLLGQMFRSVVKMGSGATPVAFHDSESENSATLMSTTPYGDFPNFASGPALSSYNYIAGMSGGLVDGLFVLKSYLWPLSRTPMPPLSSRQVVIPNWNGAGFPHWSFGMLEERYMIVNVPTATGSATICAVDLSTQSTLDLYSYMYDDALCQTIGLVTLDYQGNYYTVWPVFYREAAGGNFGGVDFYIMDHTNNHAVAKVSKATPVHPDTMFNYCNPVIWKNKVGYFFTADETTIGASIIYALTIDVVNKKATIDAVTNMTDPLESDIAAIDYTHGKAYFDASEYGAVPHYMIKELNMRTGMIGETVSSSTLGFIDVLSDSKVAYTHRGGAVIRIHDNAVVANLGARAYDYINGLCLTVEDNTGVVYCLANTEIRAYDATGLLRTIETDIPEPSVYGLTDWVRQGLSLQGDKFVAWYRTAIGGADTVRVFYDL